jgi:LmbE family N-acetylglucosaminyl deacetylase
LNTNKLLSSIKAAVLWLIRHFFFICAKPLSMEQEQGLCLVIAPHPDDETLGCGAAIMRARQAGRPVHVIIVTDGRASSRSAVITPEQLAAMRKTETEQACKLLGVESADITFLPFIDGTASDHVHAIALALEEHIHDLNPRQIFSPYGVDRHPDHRAIAAAIDELSSRGVLTAPVYEYPIWFWPWGALEHAFKPSRLSRLRRIDTKGLLKQKKAAINAHKSQSVNLTGEKDWWVLDELLITSSLQPYEIFFQK